MQENKTELLKAITQFTGQLVLKDDLASVSKTFLQALKDVKAHLENTAQQDREMGNSNNQALNSALESLRNELTESIKKGDDDSSKKLNYAVEKLIKEMMGVKDSIPAPTDLTPVYKKIDNLDLLTLDRVEKGLPMFGEAIRDGLELLQGEGRLDKSAIKGLEDFMNEMRTTMESLKKLGSNGGAVIAMRSRYIENEIPSGTIDGVNTTFTISKNTMDASSVKVYRGGSRLKLTDDYTFAGRTITFVIPPEVGEKLLVDYRI